MQPLAASLESSKAEKAPFEENRRICRPEETFERVRKLFPLFGVTRVANLTGLDRLGVPVYAAYRPNSRSLSVSQGKGSSHDAAKTSAAMESIEAWHAETIQQPLKLCSYNELFLNASCIEIARLPQVKDSTFDANKRILWIEATDLFTRETKWVPYEAVHCDYRLPLPEGHGCFVSTSNGLSSGNNYHEALIHGLCEVIERDALTVWSFRPPEQQKADKIALETITDRRVRTILDRFINARIDVGIWDITSDIRIPAFLCRILPRQEPDIVGIRPASGMGCHLSRDIALLRAVTEAAQSRLTFISGARDDMSRADYRKYLQPEEYWKWRENVREDGGKNCADISSVENRTLEQDLSVLLAALRHRKIAEAVAVNLTKEDFGIPVTRVIVPGLECALSSSRVMLGERAGRLLHQGEEPHG